MHWLDRATTLTIARTPTGRRPFHLGWGDRDVVDWYIDNAATAPPVADIELIRRPARRNGDLVMRDIEFESPFDLLPKESRVVRARWLTTDPEPERLVVLHPVWNDEDYSTRGRIARDLLDRGIASIMIQHPLYGDRRRTTGVDYPVPRVSDFCLMGRAAVLEGRSLVTELDRRGYQMGVAGYSMGGNIAGFVASLVDVPVAIAPIAAAYAAGPVFLDGVLRHTIAWDALGGDNGATVDRLQRVLTAGSILNHPPPPHMRAAAILAGSRDGFVPTSATLAIHRHWPGSQMNWINAGHASLLVRHRAEQADTIEASFDRLDALVAAA
ncbi:MAG: alpha/beta hydrolase family protein [Acidimicrobiia bacterium]